MKETTRILLTGIMICGLLIPGISSGSDKAPQKKFPDFVKEMIGKVKKDVKQSVDMNTFKTIVDTQAYDLIVDVREPAEYEDGHVPGAINIPRGLAEFTIWKKIGFPENVDTGKKIYVYCKSGGRAALTTKALQDLGFSNITLVNMKVADWKKAGLPLTED